MGKLLMNPTPNYAALFDASPYPYLLVGLDWNIIGANKSYLNAVGRTLQDILGLPLFEAFPPNPQDPDSTNDDIVRASIQRAIDTGEPDTTPFIRYAVPHQTATGVVFQPLYWSTVHTPVFNNDGKLEFVVQNAIDVTALYTFDDSAKTAQLQEQPKATFPDYSQAQAHQALMRILKSERSHLLELFNQAPGFIAVMRGPNYVFELANEAYYQLLGRREIIGKPVFEAFPDVAGQGFEELLDGVYKTGKPFLGRGIKFQVQKVAGGPFTELYIDLLYQPFFAPDGVTVTGIFAQGQDVTDIHQANLALQEADRRKDVFLSMLAHELRNPLAPISAAVEILGLSSSNPVQVINTSQVIRRQVKHMTGLVDDLLDVSRVTSGLVVLDNIAVNVDAVIKDAMEQMRPNFDKRHQEHFVLHTNAATHVCGDHKRLVQVVANLLGNASKYTKEFGTISVEVQADDKTVEISVIDNGIGMEQAFIPHMFDLFSQGKRNSDRSEGGLGLGLSLVKNLVELHGGKVSAMSPGIGLGSRFTVSLPVLAAPVANSVAPAVDAPDADHAAMRILLVDDNVDAVESLAAIFDTLGHQVKIAHDALCALELAQTNDFDACVLDIGLPDIDGYELVRRLRTLPSTQHTFIVALSGYGQQRDRALANEAGFDHYVVKPAIATDILRLLRTRQG